MLYLYYKVRIIEWIILTYLCILILFPISIFMTPTIPLTPFLQIFLIFFNLIIFIRSSVEYFEARKKGDL